MALLRWIMAAGVVTSMSACVESDLEPRALRVDMGPALIKTCADAARFGVTCGEFVQADVELLVELCTAFGDEPWTSCALTIGKADCAAVARCASPMDLGVPPQTDSGVPCASTDDCGAHQVCVADRCKKAPQ